MWNCNPTSTCTINPKSGMRNRKDLVLVPFAIDPNGKITSVLVCISMWKWPTPSSSERAVPSPKPSRGRAESVHEKRSLWPRYASRGPRWTSTWTSRSSHTRAARMSPRTSTATRKPTSTADSVSGSAKSGVWSISVFRNRNSLLAHRVFDARQRFIHHFPPVPNDCLVQVER